MERKTSKTDKYNMDYLSYIFTNDRVRTRLGLPESVSLTEENHEQILDLLQTDELEGVPFRIYLSRSTATMYKVPPDVLDFRIQRPGNYYVTRLAFLHLADQEPNEQRSFWREVKKRNRQTSNDYKKKRDIYNRERPRI